MEEKELPAFLKAADTLKLQGLDCNSAEKWDTMVKHENDNDDDDDDYEDMNGETDISYDKNPAKISENLSQTNISGKIVKSKKATSYKKKLGDPDDIPDSWVPGGKLTQESKFNIPPSVLQSFLTGGQFRDRKGRSTGVKAFKHFESEFVESEWFIRGTRKGKTGKILLK